MKTYRKGSKTSNLAYTILLAQEPGTNFTKIRLSVCANGSVGFGRYCGKMYSRHVFFPYMVDYGNNVQSEL